MGKLDRKTESKLIKLYTLASLPPFIFSSFLVALLPSLPMDTLPMIFPQLFFFFGLFELSTKATASAKKWCYLRLQGHPRAALMEGEVNLCSFHL